MKAPSGRFRRQGGHRSPRAYPSARRHEASRRSPRVRRLLDEGRIWVKVTEPYEDSKLGPPYADSSEVARAYVQAAPERILWGTDWPHPDPARHQAG